MVCEETPGARPGIYPYIASTYLQTRLALSALRSDLAFHAPSRTLCTLNYMHTLNIISADRPFMADSIDFVSADKSVSAEIS